MEERRLGMYLHIYILLLFLKLSKLYGYNSPKKVDEVLNLKQKIILFSFLIPVLGLWC
jgi:hypothetical protein